MRIRGRRPPPLLPDPPLLHPQPPSNGAAKDAGAKKPGGALGLLHQAMDLRRGVDPHPNRCCTTPPDPNFVQVVVDSSKTGDDDDGAGVNSNRSGAYEWEEAKAVVKVRKAKVKARNGGDVNEESDIKVEGNGKKRRSPAVLMEGSRCSRVNGRGWRCCQQTLVGYSLCEHHLGKGRLRSVSSVRGQLGSTNPEFIASSSLQKKQYEQPVTISSLEDENAVRKSKKIGLAKARSINSLLGETSQAMLGPEQQATEGIALPQPLLASLPPLNSDKAVV